MIALILFALIQGGCSSDQVKELSGVTSEKTVTEELQKLIQGRNINLVEAKAFLDENIKLLSRDTASKVVIGFEELQKKSLGKLEDKYSNDSIQKELAELYKTTQIINSLEGIKDEKIKALLTETLRGGYKVETAEGYYFPIINYQVYQKYSQYLNPDTIAYFNLMATESNLLAVKDAALMIGWEEILKRATKQENFISQYQSSAKLGDIEELLNRYLLYTFYGTNNTPLFSYDSKVMVPQAKEAYYKLVNSGGKGEFLEEIQGFLTVLEKNNFKLTGEVEEYRKNALERLKANLN